MGSEFLICTNGHETTWPAIEYGAWAASAIGAPVTLLGVAEDPAKSGLDAKHPLERMFARATELFEQNGVKHTLDIQSGHAEQVIAREAAKRDCIVVTGRLDRPALKRWISGRSIRQLLAEIAVPILYVPRACIPLKKMLICLGGLGYEMNAEQLAIRLGVAGGAAVTLLHVARPVDLDYPSARAERDHWRDLEKTDSAPGRHLRQALETVRSAGLIAQIKGRQGNVVEEILSEIRQGGYDLVCMGSAYGRQGLRHLYGPNVTDEVADSASCPILTARYASSGEK